MVESLGCGDRLDDTISEEVLCIGSQPNSSVIQYPYIETNWNQLGSILIALRMCAEYLW